MKRLVIALAALFACMAFSGSAHAQIGSNCQASAFYDASTNGSTKLVTGSATNRIFVCGFDFFAAGTANVKLVYGTGTNCATGTTAITPAFQFTIQTGLVDPSPYWRGLTPVPLGNDLCINTSAGVAVQAIVYYLIQP